MSATTDDGDEAAVEVVATPHRFVVVEGPIGVGKTSLARRLAKSFGSELVLEQDAENPFLERFYRNPRAAAFQTQLYFLFQRARQMQDLRQADLFEKVRVADYLLDKDRLFARLTLDEEEFGLYEQVYAKLSIDAPVPDLVVYLQAPVETLVDRVRAATDDVRIGLVDQVEVPDRLRPAAVARSGRIVRAAVRRGEWKPGFDGRASGRGP